MADNNHKLPPVELRNAEIIFPNFEGRKDKFNAEGRRNFCVILDDETAKKMEADGWRVKYLKPRSEGEEPQAYIQVKVNYNGWKPPQINLIYGDRIQELNEDTVDLCDKVDIEKCDMVLNPSWFEMPDGTCGYSAYLRELYIVVAMSRLAREYAQLKRDEIEEEYVDHGHVCNGDCATCPEA